MLKRLLLTATEEKNHKLTKLLAQTNIHCIHCPLIKFSIKEDITILDNDYKSAVFTSHFAIQEFNRLYPKYQFDYIFLLSNALKKLWLKYYPDFPQKKITVSTQAQQESITKNILQQNISGNILFPCSQLANKHLERSLSSHKNINFKRYEIYTMKEITLTVPQDFDSILFLSMSAFSQAYNKFSNDIWQKKKIIVFSKIMAKKINSKIKNKNIFYPKKSSLELLAKYIKSL